MLLNPVKFLLFQCVLYAQTFVHVFVFEVEIGHPDTRILSLEDQVPRSHERLFQIRQRLSHSTAYAGVGSNTDELPCLTKAAASINETN